MEGASAQHRPHRSALPTVDMPTQLLSEGDFKASSGNLFAAGGLLHVLGPTWPCHSTVVTLQMAWPVPPGSTFPKLAGDPCASQVTHVMLLVHGVSPWVWLMSRHTG